MPTLLVVFLQVAAEELTWCSNKLANHHTEIDKVDITRLTKRLIRIVFSIPAHSSQLGVTRGNERKEGRVIRSRN
jgi:hypothetical protein